MKRLWILGNGPTLQKVDMNLLGGEEVWVLNRFHLLQEVNPHYVEPTRWWWMDNPFDRQQWAELGELINTGKPMFVRHDLVANALSQGLVKVPFNSNLTAVLHDSGKQWENSSIDYYRQNGLGFPRWELKPNDHKWLSPCRGDFPNVYPHLVWRFLNSIAVLLQAAALDGYKEIYLMGCDGGFKNMQDAHFHPNYYPEDYKLYSGIGEAENESIRVTHVFARELYGRMGIECFNANPDGLGEIEVWPRTDYREVINGRG